MTIRDYHVIRQLGEGGMGTVYLVEEPLLDRKVAVKVLNPELMANQELVERFRQEAKVQSGLVHPGIVQLYTFFKEDGKYCMVMEYVEGETLRALIERTGPLGEARSLKIFGEVLEAVQYAHGRGVIHRDLKPSNIMISDGMTAKVMDFGIAKVLGDRGLTHTGTRMGTVYYMSPEQVRAEKTIDQRTDFYSLGITLYETLTGKLPYNIDTDSEFEIMQQIVEGKIPDPRELYPYISEETVLLLRGCIEKNKANRSVLGRPANGTVPANSLPDGEAPYTIQDHRVSAEVPHSSERLPSERLHDGSVTPLVDYSSFHPLRPPAPPSSSLPSERLHGTKQGGGSTKAFVKVMTGIAVYLTIWLVLLLMSHFMK
jgi:serine/threonine protein kinase